MKPAIPGNKIPFYHCVGCIFPWKTTGMLKEEETFMLMPLLVSMHLLAGGAFCLNSLKKLIQRHAKAQREYLQGPQRRVLEPSLYIADIGAPQPCMLCEVILIPIPALSHGADTFSDTNTNVFFCHMSRLNVFF